MTQEIGLRERKKLATRFALRSTGLRLFREKGFHATTAAEIAAEVGVSTTTFFNYFPTKEDVVVALPAERRAMLSEQLRIVKADGDPAETLRRAAAETFAEAVQLGVILDALQLMTEEPALRSAARQRLDSVEADLFAVHDRPDASAVERLATRASCAAAVAALLSALLGFPAVADELDLAAAIDAALLPLTRTS